MQKYARSKLFRIIPLILILVILCTAFAGCGKTSKQTITSAAQLNSADFTISVDPGSASANTAVKTFPNANIVYNNSSSDAYLAVEQGKSDAFVYGRVQMQYAISSQSLDNLAIMDESLDTSDIAAGISPKNTELLDDVNAFIKKIKADGTFDDMYTRWIVNADNTMPEIAKPENPTKKYKFGTAGLVVPMNYIENNKVTGFDVEFMNRLALYLNADIEIQTMSFDALIASLETNKLDLVVSDLNVTPERKKVILMSDPYMTSDTAIIVRKDRLDIDSSSITSVDQLHGKKIGIVGGSSYDRHIAEKYADSEIIYSASYADLMVSLKNGKIDTYIADKPSAVCQAAQTDGIKYLDELLTKEDYAFVLAKDNVDLQQQINEVFAQFRSDGTFDEMSKKWIEPNGTKKMTDVSSYDTPNGVLRVATSCDAAPFSYMQNNEIVGYDIDIIMLTAAKLGYKVELLNVAFDGIIANVSSGKSDVAVDCLSITPERKKMVLFTDPDYSSGTVAMVLDGTTTEKTFIDKIKDSFERTFVTEQRWKLVLNGLLVTIELSILSAIFGTALGFLFSFPLRSKNKFIRRLCSIVSTVMDGMPIVVILMVLYYVIFSKSTLPAVWIGILGFTLDFANAVAGLLNTGVQAVDKGQLEAASSMGYSRWQIFIKITLPQAARQMFSQYNGAIVGLIKGTAVIGYITVEDLTKASDIIRSRTFEAFFPLIVTAIIYFVLARIIVAILSRISLKLDPKHRKRIVKGVNLHD